MSDPQDRFADLRSAMVTTQIEARGIEDQRVIAALRRIPRHLFVPEEIQVRAYDDEPLPIGEGQTISQPYIVAFMTEALELRGAEKVLEIGTGSGYQTAVLAALAREVYTVEILGSLSARAESVLGSLGVGNVRFKVGDGTSGWDQHAPYDAIIVTAAPPSVPKRLQDQLAQPGRMVLPVGSGFQELVLVRKDGKGVHKTNLLSVRFVPMVSAH